MKLFILAALALVATVTAAPAETLRPSTEKAEILEQSVQKDNNGNFKTSIKVSNGINENAEGQLKEVTDAENKVHTVVVVKGSYDQLDENGVPHTITYYADEFGFHVSGDILPKDRR